jgi:hypothetical protein
MKKLEENKVLYVIVQCLVMTVMAMIIWPLFDLFFCKVIDHTKFTYSLLDHVIEPIIFGIIAGIVFSLIEFRKNKKNK